MACKKKAYNMYLFSYFEDISCRCSTNVWVHIKLLSNMLGNVRLFTYKEHATSVIFATAQNYKVIDSRPSPHQIRIKMHFLPLITQRYNFSLLFGPIWSWSLQKDRSDLKENAIQPSCTLLFSAQCVRLNDQIVKLLVRSFF